MRGISLRPFSVTAKYSKPDDLQPAAKELRVARIVTGHYLKAQNEVQLTLEAVDTANNRVVWQKPLTVSSKDALGMRDQVTSSVLNGMIPALGIKNANEESGTKPKNEEAYDLYLRSVAIAHDGQGNQDAIRMLERSVGLDSTFAPAWSALGIRYYYDSEYGSGVDREWARSEKALRRALSLDPNFVEAEQQIILQDTDRGNLVSAYKQAKAMVAHHPQSGIAHFTLSYVLRYASVLAEARQECDTAIRLDPGNYQFRSCATIYIGSDHPERARLFFDLDSGSEWSNSVSAIELIRNGKTSEAVAKLRQLPDSAFFHTRAIEVCYSNPRPANYQEVMDKVKKALPAMSDPEPRYSQAITFNPCLGDAFTIEVIRKAIKDGFCAYEMLDVDSKNLPNLRNSSEFAAVLAEARQCRDNFLANRDKPQ